ncbi:hypothetical protein PBY51_014700 [Eleginops maclovinus]|uniref:Spermatogenesis-associated protein 2 PUB-like domain-containing protein n=1 Tax=Eleginops maclovinus TaxID=56733 RepID=A0AAN8AB65_ELEMC|nr:hypothetical protein PBY51_014700 [Eleginops maclovinus]
MKDGSREEQVSRHGVFEDYENFLLHLCQEVGPCRDPPLLQKAARYLQTGEPAETFLLLPFYQTALQGCRALSTDCRKHLSAVIKAAELLETLCVNLFLQPWKKEIRTLKTYTGPFVYYLLPVLSSSTIQSVLASIGYLPHTDTPLSEYRLSEDADPQRAMLLGFELLLARVECYNLLELLEKLGPQEWLGVLRRKAGPQKLEDAPEENTTKAQKEKEEEEGEVKKEEQADRKEAPLSSDNRLEFRPQPKPRRNHLNSVDQSIMEMHISYPDLSIKGRRLVPHRALRADSSWSGSREAPTGSTSYSDVAEAVKGPTAAAATTVRRRDDGLTAEDVTGDQRGVAGCTDRSSGSASSSTTDGGRLDDELSGPLSLHLTHSLRAGSAAGQSPEPGDTQPPAEPPAEHTAAELQNKTADPQKLSSLSSLDEVKMLKELEERMGQLCVQDTKEEGKGKDYKREEENTTKERRRRRREKKASAEGEAEEQNLGKPLIETGPAPSHAACRSSQSHPTEMKEQKQPAECPHSPLSARKANCQICAGETGQGEEEQLAQSFVIL